MKKPEIDVGIRDWATKWLATEMPDRPEPWHDLRYAMTLGYLCANGLLFRDAKVLELGGPSPFTDLLAAGEPCNVEHLDPSVDLRDFDARVCLGAFDLVLCTEVIEHVHDLPTTDHDYRARWVGSGQRHVLRQGLRCCKPTGSLFITTPNAAGLKAVNNVVRGLMPQTYEPHVRELTLPVLERLVVGVGGVVVDSGSWTVWEHHGLSRRDAEQTCRAIQLLGADPRERGDDLYLTAKRDFRGCSD